jgi:hypothetical protein
MEHLIMHPLAQWMRRAASDEHEVVPTLRKWIDAMLRCRSVGIEIRESSSGGEWI